MAKNYWDRLINDSSVSKEELFFKIRDCYTACLRHLFDDVKDIPDYDIYFSTKEVTEEEGFEKGYPVIKVDRRGSDIQSLTIKDVSELPNFNNSYTWMEDNVFISVDFQDNDISALQFVTQSFIEEVIRELSTGGMRNLKIQHMYDLLVSTGIVDFFYGFYRLDVNFLQNLSAMAYEKTFSEGRIFIPRFNTKLVRRTKAGLKVGFEETVPFTIDNLRQVRKLLELSDQEMALVVNDSGKVIGLTDQHAHPEEAEIRIHGHLYWSILFGTNGRLVYRNARYHIPSSRKSNPELKEYLKDIDENLTAPMLQKLEEIILQVASLKHGTIIIVGSPEMAQSETKRLTAARTGIAIHPVNLEHQFKLIKSFSMIDGAIIMDTHCNCVCIGAILDGDAVAKGSRARGSRFNSTVNYVKRRSDFDEHFLGVVVSDDGSVDVVNEEKVFHLTSGN